MVYILVEIALFSSGELQSVKLTKGKYLSMEGILAACQIYSAKYFKDRFFVFHILHCSVKHNVLHVDLENI